jgi:NAD(P)-dependent dehydrogenase (short-subunit alcohol dehydrogenase family)
MAQDVPTELETPAPSLVIITGGGRRIGASVALQVAALGHHVLVNYINNRNSAEAIANHIRLSGGEAGTCQADIGTEHGVATLYAAADEVRLPLVGLVNSAGVSGGLSRLDSLSDEALRRVFAVNVIGVMLCSREAVLRMSTKHGGRGEILLMSHPSPRS